ncbi:thiamine-phosphate pyrophosphorylase [Chitinophaga sp. CF118]|uniref:thiamine phosphate synthase n=1 Tax=Chitinophaga sp. CF118 TaxID=1884367 RepID=UPI0008E126BE|nr:thiamine phosphate synthase [Chitinophaga sp. CF118]SFD32702.1 thiamine-phosphate pyrophosphorylase [Chitinophaga sp. CF118]
MIQIITHTENIPDETDIWKQLLNEGADSILVRKPGWQEADYELLLLQADPGCYGRLMIPEHATLCERYGLLGLHFGEAARGNITMEHLNSYRQKEWLLSTSIHNVETLHATSNDWNQLLLSPVFNSISKKGYAAAFDENFRLNKEGFEGNVLALGGINDITANKARDMQFDGIALLGAIWQEPERAVREFCRIRDIWRKN